LGKEKRKGKNNEIKKIKNEKNTRNLGWHSQNAMAKK
jgi:hypothetical protein